MAQLETHFLSSFTLSKKKHKESCLMMEATCVSYHFRPAVKAEPDGRPIISLEPAGSVYFVG